MYTTICKTLGWFILLNVSDATGLGVDAKIIKTNKWNITDQMSVKNGTEEN